MLFSIIDILKLYLLKTMKQVHLHFEGGGEKDSMSEPTGYRIYSIHLRFYHFGKTGSSCNIARFRQIKN